MTLDLGLYLVLDPGLCRDRGMVETARLAVAGGATIVQLRDKDADTARLIEAGRALRTALAGSGAMLIVNDDVEAALAIGADGVHVGQDDMDPGEVRRRLGPRALLGLSVETVDAAQRVDPVLVDYAGAGPVFATATKPDHKPPVGFAGLAEIVRACPVPVVAIGGLAAGHADAVRASGAMGMAVVSAICGQADPRAAARAMAQAWQAAVAAGG
ncbi:thiamine phosphate synthase [Pseudooceanicola sediminis]|uniref:Thiamine-phosphate synthase n=1 Tax=Pseudooceanicola sediminis TaxID=2211117 RepID=A0A399J5E6_9RHOB|nr:thiamine phosphate synthase [Pseudooceanicola sediminis]KAA2311415.1 thiamine phosphate synthase [Puniceibacterium sp. HSS470]RII38036.1 thiamine phosphate synthase [Pseudooceanicola sediminis]|tara:strand:+ start:5750 stop:6391 length:642 start_codon:yes stop_codon:yes gene_type:complete